MVVSIFINSLGNASKFWLETNYQKQIQLISNGSELVPVCGLLLLFLMLIVPLLIQLEPSTCTFQWVIMCLSDIDDTKFDHLY